MAKQTLKLFFSLFVLSNCSNNKTSIVKENRINYFDSIQSVNINYLDSLKLARFNDSAKWLLYTIHCDDSAISGRNKYKIEIPKVPIGFLPIKLCYISLKNDKLSLLYNFFVDDSSYVERTSNPSYLTNGIEFDITSDKVTGYLKGDAILNELGSTSRYFNSLQPEVISFIRNNKDRLDKWFKNEAIKKKILQ